MSRTIRRKNANVPKWVGTEPVFAEGFRWLKVFLYYVKTSETQYRKELAKFHSDHGCLSHDYKQRVKDCWPFEVSSKTRARVKRSLKNQVNSLDLDEVWIVADVWRRRNWK